MPQAHSPGSQPRKSPRQRRAKITVDAILEAAAHVLIERGPSGLTTNHIAARAGVSIGSVYQYYPNKGAILAALQKAEMKSTLGETATILNNTTLDPLERIRLAIHSFFKSEVEERELRRALTRAEVFFEEDPAAQDGRAIAVEQIHSFMVANKLAKAEDKFLAGLGYDDDRKYCRGSHVAERYDRRTQVGGRSLQDGHQGRHPGRLNTLNIGQVRDRLPSEV